MICRICQDIGVLENHELTKTTARVRVLMDGLKPLIKDTIIEFDTGEEATISLEYERLEDHCSIWLLLSHQSQNCPLKAPPATRLEAPSHHMTSYPAEKTTEDRSQSPLRSSFPRRDRAHVPTGNKDLEFRTRVDRHGNTFGTRVSTKHTRNSPPEDSSHSSSLRLRTERKDRNESTRSVEITSPQYVHTRERNQRS